MALAPTNLPGAQADGGGDESSYVSVADLLHDQDLEAVRGGEWFKQRHDVHDSVSGGGSGVHTWQWLDVCVER